MYAIRSYYDVSFFAALIPNRWHGKIVNALEGREEADTFPTFYRANNRKSFRRQAGFRAGVHLKFFRAEKALCLFDTVSIHEKDVARIKVDFLNPESAFHVYHEGGKNAGGVITSYSIHYTKLYEAITSIITLGLIYLFFPLSILIVPFLPLAFLALVISFNAFPIIRKYVIQPYYDNKGELNPEFEYLNVITSYSIHYTKLYDSIIFL